MEINEKQGSSGVAKAGLTTGIIGTSLGALAGLGELTGWGRRSAPVDAAASMAAPALGAALAAMVGKGSCSEDHTVNRYELAQEQEIAKLRSEIALRDANTYGDQKMLEMYKYIDGQFKDIREELCGQKVVNQANKDSFQLVSERLMGVKSELECQIHRERDERKCADNAIVTYTNATFYPKMVADITTGTGTTAQSTYNPLPCDCCCK